MGYVCPVCTDPQADAEHLANHLAFTALLRGGDHESWLAEHVPDWQDIDEGTLAGRVTADADETEFPQVFEDTTGGQESETGHTRRSDLPPGADALTGETRGEDADEVLAAARELTRRRHGETGSEEADGAGSASEPETEPE